MNGKELRRIRKQLELTQVQLANELGIYPNSVARQERGEIGISEPVARLVKMIAKQKRKGR